MTGTNPPLDGATFRASPEDEAWAVEQTRFPVTECKVENAPEPFDKSRLQQSLDQLCRIHDVLPTACHVVSGKAYFKARSKSLSITHSGDPRRKRVEPLEEFGTLTGPACALELSSDNRTLVVFVNHLYLDGRSAHLLIQALDHLYTSGVSSMHIRDRRTVLRMADWAREQRLTLDSRGPELRQRIRERLTPALRLLSSPDTMAEEQQLETGVVSTELALPPILARARSVRSSMMTLLLAVLAQAQQEVSGDGAAMLRVPYLNRHARGSETVLGNLATQLVLAIKQSSVGLEPLVRSAAEEVVGAMHTSAVPGSDAVFDEILNSTGRNSHSFGPIVHLRPDPSKLQLTLNHAVVQETIHRRRPSGQKYQIDFEPFGRSLRARLDYANLTSAQRSRAEDSFNLAVSILRGLPSE